MKTFIVDAYDLEHSWSANFLDRREKVEKFFSTHNMINVDTPVEKMTDVNKRGTKVKELNPVDIAIIQKLIKDHQKLKRILGAMDEEVQIN